MKLFVHALEREDAAHLRETLREALGEGAPRAELWASHLRDEEGSPHRVSLTLHAPRLRSLHVEARGRALEPAARDAVLALGERLAKEATRVRATVVTREDRVDRGRWWTFKPRHGPL